MHDEIFAKQKANIMELKIQLPQEVLQLINRLENIEKLLILKTTNSQPEADQLLTVPQVAEFLSLSNQTVYGLISKGVIPFMKRSKRVYFSKIELLHYLKQGKKKTTSEIEAETDAFLSTHKRKGGGHV